MISVLRQPQRGLTHLKYLTSSNLLNKNLVVRTTQIPIRYNSWSESVAGIYTEISNSQLVHLCQQSLILTHEYTGLPWFGTIFITTIALRSMITLPLAVYTNKIRARLELISIELQSLNDELKGEVARAKQMYKLDDRQASLLYRRSLKKQWDKLVVRENCHPMKTMVVLWGQIPLWICQSVAIRNMLNMLPNPSSLDAQMTLMQLSVGGCGWFPDLTIADSTWILPITFGILNLMNVEFHSLERKGPKSRFGNAMTNIFRVFSIGMIPVAASMPTCLVLYWTSSSAFSLMQNVILVSPRIKRLFKVPTNTPSHSDNPYQGIKERFLEKWTFKK